MRYLGVRLHELFHRLGSGRAHWAIMAVAVLLVAPSIGERFVFDDNTHEILKRADPGVVGHRSGPLHFFVFASGNPSDVKKMVDEGVLAWWTLPEFKNAFFRPLSALTHLLDGVLWPGSARLMHVHTILWYAALLAAVAALYRRLHENAWLGGVAFLLYAIDDAHGQTIGWNANRNAAIGSLFAVLALVFHDEFRRGGKRATAILGPLALGIGLFAGEIAIGACGYVLSYALFLDRAPFRGRLFSLLPYGLVVAGWRAIYSSMGYGSYGSDAYIDPGGETGAYLLALPKRLGMLMMGQFGAPGADAAFFGPPDEQWVLYLAATITVVSLTWLLRRELREEKTVKFWALGLVLAAIPMCASFSSDRQLLLVGIGGSALVAVVVSTFVRRLAAREKVPFVTALLSSGFILLHLVVAPVLLPLRARSLEVLGRALDRADRSIPDDNSIRGKTLILTNVPIDQFASWLHVTRERRGAPRPAHIYWLSTSTSPVEIVRPSERTVRVTPERGYLHTEPERLFRAARHPLRDGDEIELRTLTAKVTAVTADGRPSSTEFRFHDPIDSESYVWMSWRDGQYVRVSAPEIGARVQLPREDFVQILLAEALR